MQFNVLKQMIQQGPLTVKVTGDCMQRSIPVGSDIKVEEYNRYLPGDILTFKRGEDQIVSHRFLGYMPGRRGWLVLTRADNAQDADVPITQEHVLGLVTHVDGKPFQASAGDRLGAQLDWFPMVINLAVRSLGQSISALRKA